MAMLVSDFLTEPRLYERPVVGISSSFSHILCTRNLCVRCFLFAAFLSNNRAKAPPSEA
jgi:hypothetical protein